MNAEQNNKYMDFDFNEFESEYFKKKFNGNDKDSDASHNSEEYRKIRSTGYYPMYSGNILNNMNLLKTHSLIKEGDKFLDLGSGFGYAVVCAAYYGLQAQGIEINPLLAEGSNELFKYVKQEKIINPDSICNVVEGSYFPDEYLELRNSKKSIAKKYEIKLKTAEKNINHVFHPKGNDFDIYEKLGVRLNEIDLFYNYCWRDNVPSVTEIFSLYAKDDAILMIQSAGFPLKFDKLLNELNLDMGPMKGFNKITKKKVTKKKNLKQGIYSFFQ